MKRLFICLIVLVSVLQVDAQQPISLQWDFTGQGISVTEAQSYSYTVFIDSGSGVPLTALCGLSNNIPTCVAPLPIPTNGTHTLFLRASNSLGTAQSDTITFKYPGTPGKPINLVVTKGA